MDAPCAHTGGNGEATAGATESAAGCARRCGSRRLTRSPATKKLLANFSADCYSFWSVDEQITVEIDTPHEARGGELRALLTVISERTGTKQLLHQADFNLNGTRSRQDVVRSLAQRIPAEEVDWAAVLEQVCYDSRLHWREGEPLLYLPDYEPETCNRFLLSPFVELGGPTVIFAMGGTGKSLFALALGLSVGAGIDALCGPPLEQRRVAYLDWETEPTTHHERLRALCNGLTLPVREAGIWYQKQTASLAESAPSLRRKLAKEQIGFVIVDSLGAARGGEPESADSTIRLFAAARSLGLPWIGVDHMTKNGGVDQATPFGSVYTHNMARATWALETVDEGGANCATVVLTNRKANNGPLMGRRAYEVTFRHDADDRLTLVTYEPANVRDIPAMADRLPQHEQIALVLERNRVPMTPKDIETALEADGRGIKLNAVRMNLSHYGGRFVRLEDGRWALRSDREESR